MQLNKEKESKHIIIKILNFVKKFILSSLSDLSRV